MDTKSNDKKIFYLKKLHISPHNKVVQFATCHRQIIQLKHQWSKKELP